MHFKIYPENEELHDFLSYGDNAFISQWTGKATAEKVFSLWDSEPDIDPNKGSDIDWDVQGHLQLQDTTFYYQMRPDNIVLNKFSLDIPAGKTVALVGRSGQDDPSKAAFFFLNPAFLFFSSFMRSLTRSIRLEFPNPMLFLFCCDRIGIKGLALEIMRTANVTAPT